MKKEIIYIVVPVLLTVIGLLYKIMFVSDTLNKMQEVKNENINLVAQYNRDSLVQKNVSNIKDLYEKNKRDNRSFGEVIAELLKVTEDMLKKASVQYDGNDINQEIEETKDPKAGTASFFISLDITTDFSKLVKLFSIIESSEHIVNVKSLEIRRTRTKESNKNNVTGQDDGNTEEDEYNVKEPLRAVVNLEFVKFI